MMLGRRSMWIVPDGVSSIRTEYTDHAPITAPANENIVIFSAPESPLQERRTTFLDQDGQPVLVIDRSASPAPADAAPAPAPAAPETDVTHTGVVHGIGVRGAGLEAVYELQVRLNGSPGSYVVLERPTCAGKQRVRSFYGSSTPFTVIAIPPSFADFRNARWCPGTYRGTIRPQGARKPIGTFSFQVQ